MPEGPEVKTMVDRLQKFKGSNLKEINILSGRYKRHCPPTNIKEFKKTLPDKIDSINSKGKFIWIEMKSGWSIWITLGMTGHFVNRKMKHAHIQFKTGKGVFYKKDVRNFGCMFFCNDKKSLEKKISELGPDLIVETVTKDYLYNKIKSSRSKKTIAEYLLDQKVLSGVGNYVRADAMYLAGVNPFKNIQELTKKEAENIQKAVKKILRKNYKCQLKNYYCKFIIYGLEFTDKGEQIIRTKHKGRTIHWVPTHQK